MIEKPTQPAEPAEIKKHIETIVGHEIDPGAERVIKFSLPLGSYAVLWMDESAQACFRRIFPVPGKECSIVQLLDAVGVSSTLADGKRVFQVSDVVCPQGVTFGFAEPINIVATPRAESPNLPHHDLLADTAGSGSIIHPDVQITVFAWNANGSPAPNVVFDWRCRAVIFTTSL